MTISHTRAKKERQAEGKSPRLYSMHAIGKMRIEYIKLRARERKAKQRQSEQAE